VAHPDWPYVSVSVIADQPGQIIVQEGGAGSLVTTASISVPGGTNAVYLNLEVRKQNFSVSYVNGNSAQATFNFQVTVGAAQSDTDPQRLLWMIFQELRAQSMLLNWLKEPDGTRMSLQFGRDTTLPQ
jgi:hypothetical protein